MSSTRNVTGVVLSRRLFKHHDRTYTLFTKEEGKVFTRAQGVLKIKSKLAGQLEPYRVSEFHIARSRTIDKIAGCVTVEPFPNITKDLNKTTTAAAIAEVVDLLHREAQPDEQTYDLIVEMLRHLNKKSVNLLTTYAFSWKLLRYTGFQPQWDVCVQCRQARGEWSYIDPVRGGAVCTNCRGEANSSVKKAIEILNTFDACALSEAQHCAMDQETWNHVAFTIRRAIESVVNQELRSFDLLHKQLQSNSHNQNI